MNKKIKRIIAVALTISAFSTISPISNFMTTKAYASSSSTRLHSLYLSDGSINFSSGTSSYDVNVNSSVDQITITAKPEDTDSTVEIDGTTVDDSDHYRDTVSLDRGSNTIKVKVTDTDDNTRTYTLYIRRGTSSSSSNGDVYLNTLDLSDGDISFDQDKTSYSVRVKSSVDQIDITAEPEDDYDTVTINGSTVDDNDNWQKTVHLAKGDNKIKVKVEDDQDSGNTRTYTLNITRGSSSDSASDSYLDELSVSDNSISLTDNKTSYDVTTDESVDQIDVRAIPRDDNDTAVIDGTIVDSHDDYKKTLSLNEGKNAFAVKVKDVYGKELRSYTLNVIRGEDTTASNQNSSSGTQIKNNWYYDRDTSKCYYYDENGNKVTGWKYIGNDWYLFNSNGEMLTGWQQVGWNWYYMYDSGVMASNTVISGYKVGSDGAWIR